MAVFASLAAGMSPAAADQQPGSISISPSVVMLRGDEGQGHTQELRLTNLTSRELAFELMVADVVVRDGKRAYLPAGELPDSIAATAVFSQGEVVVPAGGTATVEVTLTVPPGTSVRAVAAGFRGLTRMAAAGGVQMTASLASLITFNLTSDVGVEATDVTVGPQTDTTNLAVSQVLTNRGSEPVVPQGVVALLDDRGQLVGRIPVEPQRLLPGEALTFAGEYPARLRSGRYRAIVSYEFEGQVLTTSREFELPPTPGDTRRVVAAVGPGGR